MAIKNSNMNIQSIEVSTDKKVVYCDNQIITYWYDGQITTEEVTNSNKNCNMNIQSIEVSTDKRVLYCDDKTITYWFDGRITKEVTNS